MDRAQARKKAEALVAKMTIEERAGQLKYDAPAIERLGIPTYNWWNEALHGVARAGTATVFPQAIGCAAMFDEEEMQEVSVAKMAVTKNRMPTKVPALPIAANTLGSETNIRLGPALMPSVPENTYTAGMIMAPASRATPVSKISI